MSLIVVVVISVFSSCESDRLNPNDYTLKFVEKLETKDTYTNAVNLGFIEHQKGVLVKGNLNNNIDIDISRPSDNG